MNLPLVSPQKKKQPPKNLSVVKRINEKEYYKNKVISFAPILKTYLLVFRSPLQIATSYGTLTAAFQILKGRRFEARARDNWFCICALYKLWLINSWYKISTTSWTGINWIIDKKQNITKFFNSFLLMWWKKQGAEFRICRGLWKIWRAKHDKVLVSTCTLQLKQRRTCFGCGNTLNLNSSNAAPP